MSEIGLLFYFPFIVNYLSMPLITDFIKTEDGDSFAKSTVNL